MSFRIRSLYSIFLKLIIIIIIEFALINISFGDDALIDTGDYVWREDHCAEVYTWTSYTNPQFYFDADKGIGTESLTIELDKSGKNYPRSIEKGDLEYITTSKNAEFKHKDWGSYKVIGFMGKKYFAGYNGINGTSFDEIMDLVNDGRLCKILEDDNVEFTCRVNSAISLEDGYELHILSLDVRGNKARITLVKRGDQTNNPEILTENIGSSTYICKKQIGSYYVPIILVHLSKIFTNQTESFATIDGIFQISDTSRSLDDVKRSKVMDINYGSGKIIVKNREPVTLIKGTNKWISDDVGENIGFQIADDDKLRFAPIISSILSHEIRSQVINPSECTEFVWNPYNFGGFFYDIDDDLGNEELKLNITHQTNNVLQLDTYTGAQYKTSVQNKSYKFDGWGKYGVIGFLTRKYFACYVLDTNKDAKDQVLYEGSEDKNALANHHLLEILRDDDSRSKIDYSKSLKLEQGYELSLKSIVGDRAYLELTRYGTWADSKQIDLSINATLADRTYYYRKDVGDAKNLIIIAVHFENILDTNGIAIVDGTWQLSETPKLTIKAGDTYAFMKVQSVTPYGIYMNNSDAIVPLYKNEDIFLTGNIKLRIDNLDMIPSKLYIYNAS